MAVDTAGLEQQVRELEAAVGSLSDRNHQLGWLADLRSHLISNMLHDLSAPVVAIRGYGKMLLEEQAAISPEQREHLGVVLGNTERVVALLNKMLRLISQPPLELEVCDLRELWQDSLTLVQHRASEKSVQISSVFSEKPFLAVADKDSLTLVLNWLALNAVKASPNGGCVVAEFTRQDESIRARVSDGGDPVPREIADTLMSGSLHSEGGAAGPSIVHDIVRLHGGRTSVVSRPGGGNSILVALADVMVRGTRKEASADEQA